MPRDSWYAAGLRVHAAVSWHGMEGRGGTAAQVVAEDDACIRVAVSQGENKGYQFKTHPNIDKNLYNSQVTACDVPLATCSPPPSSPAVHPGLYQTAAPRRACRQD
jgi:hypothetical protein